MSSVLRYDCSANIDNSCEIGNVNGLTKLLTNCILC